MVCVLVLNIVTNNPRYVEIMWKESCCTCKHEMQLYYCGEVAKGIHQWEWYSSEPIAVSIESLQEIFYNIDSWNIRVCVGSPLSK